MPSATMFCILGHQEVIGSISFKANSMLSVVLLWNDFGPLGGHRQHLIRGELGQFHAIGMPTSLD
jgi:hypothetical protein